MSGDASLFILIFIPSLLCFDIGSGESFLPALSNEEIHERLKTEKQVVTRVGSASDCSRDKCPHMISLCPEGGTCLVDSNCDNGECICYVNIKCSNVTGTAMGHGREAGSDYSDGDDYTESEASNNNTASTNNISSGGNAGLNHNNSLPDADGSNNSNNALLASNQMDNIIKNKSDVHHFKHKACMKNPPSQDICFRWSRSACEAKNKEKCDGVGLCGFSGQNDSSPCCYTLLCKMGDDNRASPELSPGMEGNQSFFQQTSAFMSGAGNNSGISAFNSSSQAGGLQQVGGPQETMQGQSGVNPQHQDNPLQNGDGNSNTDNQEASEAGSEYSDDYASPVEGGAEENRSVNNQVPGQNANGAGDMGIPNNYMDNNANNLVNIGNTHPGRSTGQLENGNALVGSATVNHNSPSGQLNVESMNGGTSSMGNERPTSYGQHDIVINNDHGTLQNNGQNSKIQTEASSTNSNGGGQYDTMQQQNYQVNHRGSDTIQLGPVAEIIRVSHSRNSQPQTEFSNSTQNSQSANSGGVQGQEGGNSSESQSISHINNDYISTNSRAPSQSQDISMQFNNVNSNTLDRNNPSNLESKDGFKNGQQSENQRFSMVSENGNQVDSTPTDINSNVENNFGSVGNILPRHQENVIKPQDNSHNSNREFNNNRFPKKNNHQERSDTTDNLEKSPPLEESHKMGNVNLEDDTETNTVESSSHDLFNMDEDSTTHTPHTTIHELDQDYGDSNELFPDNLGTSTISPEKETHKKKHGGSHHERSKKKHHINKDKKNDDGFKDVKSKAIEELKHIEHQHVEALNDFLSNVKDKLKDEDIDDVLRNSELIDTVAKDMSKKDKNDDDNEDVNEDTTVVPDDESHLESTENKSSENTDQDSTTSSDVGEDLGGDDYDDDFGDDEIKPPEQKTLDKKRDNEKNKLLTSLKEDISKIKNALNSLTSALSKEQVKLNELKSHNNVPSESNGTNNSENKTMPNDHKIDHEGLNQDYDSEAGSETFPENPTSTNDQETIQTQTQFTSSPATLLPPSPLWSLGGNESSSTDSSGIGYANDTTNEIQNHNYNGINNFQPINRSTIADKLQLNDENVGHPYDKLNLTSEEEHVPSAMSSLNQHSSVEKVRDGPELFQYCFSNVSSDQCTYKFALEECGKIRKDHECVKSSCKYIHKEEKSTCCVRYNCKLGQTLEETQARCVDIQKTTDSDEKCRVQALDWCALDNNSTNKPSCQIGSEYRCKYKHEENSCCMKNICSEKNSAANSSSDTVVRYQYQGEPRIKESLRSSHCQTKHLCEKLEKDGLCVQGRLDCFTNFTCDRDVCECIVSASCSNIPGEANSGGNQMQVENKDYQEDGNTGESDSPGAPENSSMEFHGDNQIPVDRASITGSNSDSRNRNGPIPSDGSWGSDNDRSRSHGLIGSNDDKGSSNSSNSERSQIGPSYLEELQEFGLATLPMTKEQERGCKGICEKSVNKDMKVCSGSEPSHCISEFSCRDHCKCLIKIQCPNSQQSEVTRPSSDYSEIEKEMAKGNNGKEQEQNGDNMTGRNDNMNGRFGSQDGRGGRNEMDGNMNQYMDRSGGSMDGNAGGSKGSIDGDNENLITSSNSKAQTSYFTERVTIRMMMEEKSVRTAGYIPEARTKCESLGDSVDLGCQIKREFRSDVFCLNTYCLCYIEFNPCGNSKSDGGHFDSFSKGHASLDGISDGDEQNLMEGKKSDQGNRNEEGNDSSNSEGMNGPNLIGPSVLDHKPNDGEKVEADNNLPTGPQGNDYSRNLNGAKKIPVQNKVFDGDKVTTAGHSVIDGDTGPERQDHPDHNDSNEEGAEEEGDDYSEDYSSDEKDASYNDAGEGSRKVFYHSHVFPKATMDKLKNGGHDRVPAKSRSDCNEENQCMDVGFFCKSRHGMCAVKPVEDNGKIFCDITITCL